MDCFITGLCRTDVIVRLSVEPLSITAAQQSTPLRASNLRNPVRSYNTFSDLSSETRLCHLGCVLWSHTSVLIQHEDTM